MDDAPSLAGQVWKDPCLNASTAKLKADQSAQNSQETFPMVRSCLPWRQQVPTHHHLEELYRCGVNVSNHARSCQLKNEGWPICSKLTGDLPHGEGQHPLKTAGPYPKPSFKKQHWCTVNVPNHVRSCRLKNEVCTTSAWNSQGTCPMVSPWLQIPLRTEHGQVCLTTIPWGPAPVPGVSKCAKSCLELPAMDDAPSWAGQGWKDPCLNLASPKKVNLGQSAPKLTGDLTHGEKLPPLKMVIPYHHPPWSSAGVSKCTKSHLELLTINEAPFICCIYKMTKYL